MIQGIEKLGPELQPQLLLDWEHLEQRPIQVVRRRPDQRIAPTIAKRPQRRHRISRRIEIARNQVAAGPAGIEHRIRYQIRALGSASTQRAVRSAHYVEWR